MQISSARQLPSIGFSLDAEASLQIRGVMLHHPQTMMLFTVLRMRIEASLRVLVRENWLKDIAETDF
jgi:hypothetical protein